MATDGRTGCPTQSSDVVTTPTSDVLAANNSDNETLTVSRQDGSEICRLGQAMLTMHNVNAPIEVGTTYQYDNSRNIVIQNQHNYYRAGELEASTEDTVWSEFDEAHSLNIQDISSELLNRAVELLARYGRIVLCGPPKSGKSSLAHAILKHYQEKGFAAYLVHRLCCHYEMTKGRKGPSIVLMDGSLGVLRVDKDQFNSCKDLKDRCLLVLTLYPHVLRDLAMLENSCPLLPPSVVIEMKPHLHQSLSYMDYLPSLKAMIKDRDDGHVLLALLAICMQECYHFDQDPSEVAHGLQHLGFTNVAPCDLKLLANILKGSILPSTDNGFPSRALYDAAGLALGSFFEYVLLRVCDATFMVQHVRTSGMPADSIVLIDPENKAYPALMQRMYEILMDGQMSELCQHPSLRNPDFMRDFEAFCARHENYVHQLGNAVDKKYGLPLLYWSLFCPLKQLIHWCLTITSECITSWKVLSESLLSAALAVVVLAGDAGIRSTAWRLLVDLTLMKFNCAVAGILTMTLPLPTKCMKAAVCRLKTDGVCNLDDPSLPNPAALLRLIITEDVINVELPSQDWNLVVRLVADSQLDEILNNGDTLLHPAACTGHHNEIHAKSRQTFITTRGKSPCIFVCEFVVTRYGSILMPSNRRVE